MRKPRNITYVGSSLLQTIKINFDTSDRGAISTWNNYIGSTMSLLNSSGAASGSSIEFLQGAYGSEDEGSQNDPSGQFPDAVLKYMINRFGAIDFRITGLNALRSYKFTFAAVQSYTDPGDITNIVLNGVTINLGGPSNANVLYKTNYSVSNPSAGIVTMSFVPASGSTYACMNAMIIEEYTT